jgi:hypothetical protein
MQNGKEINDLATDEKFSEDLSKLFDYPSVGELFTDARRFEEFCGKLNSTRDNLERIVRYGTRDEAEKAARAARAVETTLEFLQHLQKMRQNSGK